MVTMESGNDLADGAVLRRLGAGDEGGVADLIRQHHARVFRLALRITRCEADAQEVTQDVFLAVARKHRTFDGRSSLSTWIHRITVNAALNRRRGLRHTRETSLASLSSKREHITGAVETGPTLVDRCALPDSEAVSRQQVRGLVAAIDDLPAAYRGVLFLQIDGLSTERMARALKISLAAVKSRLHRARVTLRRRIDADVRLAGLLEALA